jgi:ABC-type uncharacterized transport system fused permease/ATPase subunit
MSSGSDDEKRMMEIEKASFELDDYFVALANKYELSISALNGILMARLLRLNVETQNEESLYKLLVVILQKDHESWDKDRSIH